MKAAKTYTIWICPECREHITDFYYDPAKGTVYGHYHDPPDFSTSASDV